jgi:hypothetical protein
MTSFFRLLGNLLPSLELAQQVQNIILMCFITYSGFIIPFFKMKVWFQWFHWVDPIAYAVLISLPLYPYISLLSYLLPSPPSLQRV